MEKSEVHTVRLNGGCDRDIDVELETDDMVTAPVPRSLEAKVMLSRAIGWPR